MAVLLNEDNLKVNLDAGMQPKQT